jgi:hypothetical protein
VEAGGFPESCKGVFETTTRCLLHVKIKFILGIFMKHIRTCLLFWRDELDCGLISEKKEGLFVKHPETRVNTQRSQQCSEFCG